MGKMICAQSLHYTFGAEYQLSKEGVDVSLILLEPRYGLKLWSDFTSDLDMALKASDWSGEFISVHVACKLS
jgi:hypothetical protein